MKIPGFKSGKKKLKQVISKYEQQISTLTVDHLRKLHKLTLEKDQAEQKLEIQKNDYENWKTNTGLGIERMKNEFGTLQKEKKKNENDLMEKNQKILVLEESKKNQQTAIERQEREIKSIQKEIQQERQNNFRKEQEINALRRASTTSTNQLTLKDKQIEKMQEELKNHEENTNRKERELLRIQKDKELAVKEITSKNREIGLIIASKKEDEQKISKKELELRKIKEESMKKDELIEEISQQIKKMEKVNQQEIEKIKAEYLAEISDVEEKVQAATEKNKLYLMKLGEKEIESKELTEKLNQINQDFQEKQKEYEHEVEILGETLRKEKTMNEAQIASLQSALLKNLATINYHERFPKSSSLTLHQQDFSHSFNVQFLGARGAGKSSLINKLRKILKVNQLNGVEYTKDGKTHIDSKAETGHSEKTMETGFFDVSSAFETEIEQTIIDNVFFVDQPGIGGYKINRAGYLAKFGPGHFDLTFVLGSSGLNEDEKFIFKHLNMYNRDLVFVRSKVDADLVVSDSESEDEPDERYNDLKKENEKLISELSEDHKIHSYYIGRPSSNYPDYQGLIRLIKERICSERFLLNDSLKIALANKRFTKPGQKSLGGNNFEEPSLETQDLLIKNKFSENEKDVSVEKISSFHEKREFWEKFAKERAERVLNSFRPSQSFTYV